MIRHEFKADAPNKVWLWDISEHPTKEGKLDICAIKDVFSNKIVGYSIDTRMKGSLARAAMHNAIGLRSPVATICHSDRGGQFRAKRTQRLLANNALVGSMGRSYGAGDNASMESFFSLLQKNVLDTAGGISARTSVWRSSPGSRPSTTVAVDNAASASSRPSSLR